MTAFSMHISASCHQRGVTLIEILVAIVVLSIGLLGLAGLQLKGLQVSQGSTYRSQAALLTLPLLVPYGLSATRIAYGIAWKIALVAELLGAPSGIGYLMLKAQIAADSTTFLATCFAIVLMFVAGERLVIVPLERRFARR